MAMAPLGEALRQLRGTLDRATDAGLLARFLAGRDEAAFEALVRRHGPMVLGVCRRVLGNAHDAEDAFQATFLVLARKGASVRVGGSVGSWLYGVARRTALHARRVDARRRARESGVMHRQETAAADPWDGLREALDVELERLPEKYRTAVVLCDLEGRPRREAARQLGVPEGTLAGRLATARRLLARRLARHGVSLPAGALAAALAGGAAAVPPPLVAATVRAAAGVAPAPVAALAGGVLKMMLVARLKPAAWAFLAAVSVSAGAVGLTSSRAQSPADPLVGSAAVAQGPAARATPAQDDLEALRMEVQALRLELRATKERVKALEADRGRRPATGGASKLPPGALPTGNLQRGVSPPAHDPRSKPETGTAPSSNGARLPTGDAASGLPPSPRQESGSSLLPLPGVTAQLEVGNKPSQETPTGVIGQVREKVETREEADPAWAAQEALRRLQKDPSDRQAMEALERAVRRLKERTNPADSLQRR
jgi:RNA polymerase sigma factor (sigma-70 family)